MILKRLPLFSRNTIWYLIILGVPPLLALAFVLLYPCLQTRGVNSYGERRGPREFGEDISRTIPSPSGNYILDVKGYAIDSDENGDQWWHAKLFITGKDGTVLFQDNTDYATWLWLDIRWDESDSVLVDSGDVGKFLYHHEADVWMKQRMER